MPRDVARTPTRDSGGPGIRTALVNPLVLRRQHLLRLPRPPPAARARLHEGAAGRVPEVLLLDAHALDLGFDEVRAELRAFRPDMTVLTTAPTYLFWRCPPPELRGAQQLAAAVRNDAGVLVAVGPHGSATPGPILDKLGADAPRRRREDRASRPRSIHMNRTARQTLDEARGGQGCRRAKTLRAGSGVLRFRPAGRSAAW